LIPALRRRPDRYLVVGVLEDPKAFGCVRLADR